jgi:hypothetical protein
VSSGWSVVEIAQAASRTSSVVGSVASADFGRISVQAMTTAAATMTAATAKDRW